MVNIQVWAAFVLAAANVLVIPGPTILLVISRQGDTFFQFFILGATFLFLASFNAALYALFAGQLRDKLQNSTVRRWLNRCGGSVLICAGLATATLKRSF